MYGSKSEVKCLGVKERKSVFRRIREKCVCEQERKSIQEIKRKKFIGE